jgi:hypothetical protein
MGRIMPGRRALELCSALASRQLQFLLHHPYFMSNLPTLLRFCCLPMQHIPTAAALLAMERSRLVLLPGHVLERVLQLLPAEDRPATRLSCRQLSYAFDSNPPGAVMWGALLTPNLSGDGRFLLPISRGMGASYSQCPNLPVGCNAKLVAVNSASAHT